MFTIYSSILVAAVFVAWILYQLIREKKKFSEIKGDALAVFFFICIWAAIWYGLFGTR